MNGSTQEVRIIAPPGTLVYDTSGVELPLIMSTRTIPSSLAIVLRRNRDYNLLFRYKQSKVRTTLESRLEPIWLLGDFLFFYGFFVEPFTGDWNGFDDALRIQFPLDTLSAPRVTPISEPDAAEILFPQRGFVMGGVGFIGPVTNEFLEFVLPVCLQVGIGYNVTHHTSIVASYNTGVNLDILPNTSKYQASATYSTYDIGARFRLPENMYLAGGVGWTQVTSDSLIVNFSPSSSKYLGRFDRAPVDRSMPSFYAALGVSGKLAFLEIRHSFGFAGIPLPNREIGEFQVTSVVAGLNLFF